MAKLNDFLDEQYVLSFSEKLTLPIHKMAMILK